jgi:hypothetical protein
MDSDIPDMGKLEPFHFGKLPVWIDGNAYLAGAKEYKNEKNKFVSADEVTVELVYDPEGRPQLKTDIYDKLGDFRCGLITTDTLGRAFEPDQRFENNDGSDIIFDRDYLGNHRGADILPGPFALGKDADSPLW